MRQRRFLFLLLGLFCMTNTGIVPTPSQAQSDQPALLLYTACEDATCSERTLHLLNVVTGDEQTIVIGNPSDGYYDAGWSPDGRYIWRLETVSETQWGLRLIDVANGQERTISDELAIDSCSPSSVSWSPDGQYLLYYTGQRSDAQLHLLNMVDNSTYTDDSLKSEVYIEPVWSPDSRFLAISSGEQDRLFDVSTTTEKFSFDGVDSETSFSPDGAYLLYQGKSTDDTVVRLCDTATGELGRFPGWGRRYNWSSNSRYLVLVKYDEQGELYSMFDTQTTAFTPIDIGEPIRVGPWIDNDTALFLYGSRQLGDYYRSVLRYDIASKDVDSLFETTGWIGSTLQFEQWTIIFYSPSIEGELYEPTRRVHISNGGTVIDEEIVVEFYNPFTNAAAVTRSPDGQWLTIAARDGIYRFNADTGNLDKLPVEARYINPPFWSPDSRYLTYETYDPDALGVWDIEGDTIEMLLGPVDTIIGWQNSDVQNSLLYCGEG